MKKNALLGLTLIGLATVALQNVNGGSAVATDDRGNLATAYGGPVEREKQRALETARLRYGANFRILASTDQIGYGAIAVALLPNGHASVIGVALGKRSATEADRMAIDHCLKAGGVNPKVRWGFRG
jgi:hypothetical protein